MFDPNKPVETRDGRPARIVTTKLGSAAYPVGAILTMADGTESYDTFTASGCAFVSEPDNDGDLVNPEPRRERFINLGDSYGEAEFALNANRHYGVLKLVTDEATDRVISTEIIPALRND